MISHSLIIIEEHQDAHLIRRDRHFIALSRASNLSSDFSISLIEFPMKLSA